MTIAKTPLCEWALIGDGLSVSANKTILVWNKRTQVPELALVRDDPSDDGDPRGQLMTEDCTRRLDWADYCHFCYVGRPHESSADKGLFVYASDPDVTWRNTWTLVWRGEPHETGAAEAVRTALHAFGMATTTNRTGHLPKD